MLRLGQVPGFQFGETLNDILAALIAGQSPAGGADGGNAGDGQKSDDGAGGGSGDDSDKGSDGTAFDAARAQRTIQALRDEVKAGKAHKTALDDALTRLQVIEDKDKSDSEKALSSLTRTQAELKAAQLESESLKSKYVGALIGNAIEREAAKANAVDIETVAALVDRSAIEISDDGTVTGADKAVAALLKAKPFLVTPEGKSGAGVKDVPGTPKGGAGASREDVFAQTKRELLASGQYGRL